ncbi:MAG: hypothetical protein EOP94_00100 [Zymomonas sp.]|nr:MAG: hypothetical protein EOP94_00100 [Zymomonas sp.]
MLSALFSAAAVVALQDATYPPTYENAVECTGIIGRIASTTGDEQARAELSGQTNSLASSASRLGDTRGISDAQLEADIQAAYQQAEVLIPTTSQAEWSAAMADILPVAQQCLNLEARLVG